MKCINPQIREALQTLRGINKKKTTPRNIIVKLKKNKDKWKILKSVRDKDILSSKQR